MYTFRCLFTLISDINSSKQIKMLNKSIVLSLTARIKLLILEKRLVFIYISKVKFFYFSGTHCLEAISTGDESPIHLSENSRYQVENPGKC